MILAVRPTYAQRVAGQPLYNVDITCHCFDPAKTQVLNPLAWADPTPGTFSSSAAYYDDYRFRRIPKETFSFGRVFRIREPPREFRELAFLEQPPRPVNDEIVVLRNLQRVGARQATRKIHH
jgi:hypothetical protein